MTEADKKKIAVLEIDTGQQSGGHQSTITKEQLIKRLQELAKSAKGWEWNKEGESPESAHVNADRALLEYIGDSEVTKAFNSIDKWYA